jgi:hypothetical protein
MPTISFPRTFANLTTGQATYLDDNFNAINSWLAGGNIDSSMLNLPNVNANIAPTHITADGSPRIASATPGANVIPVGDAAGKIDVGFLPSGLTAGNLIWDSVAQGTTYPATTITISPLTGIAHGGYRFEFIIINTSGSTSIIRMFFNNDTTDSNYYYNTSNFAYFALGTGGAGILTASFSIHTGYIIISPYSGTQSSVRATYTQSTGTIASGVTVGGAFSFAYTVPILNSTDLNRIDITSAVANGICTYSRFRLWRQV